MGFGLFLKQQGEELRNCRPGERGTQAGTGRGGRVQTVGRRPDPGKRRKQMQTGEQGEGLAETWAGAGSWGPLWLRPWLHRSPHGSGGGEGRPKVSDDKLESVPHQHTTAQPGCWERQHTTAGPGCWETGESRQGCWAHSTRWMAVHGARTMGWDASLSRPHSGVLHRSVFHCELEQTLMFFTPSQLKGEYRSWPLRSTFPSTVISQKIQSAGLVSQPLICLLPHVPASSPTDPFIPSLHVHLQGKDWSPQPRCPSLLPPLPLQPPSMCPRPPCSCPGGIPSSGLGILGPSPSGFRSVWTTPSYISWGCLTFTSQQPPVSPQPSAPSPSLPVSSPAPVTLLSVLGEHRCFSPAHFSPNTVLCPVRWPPCFWHRLLIHKAPSPFFPGTQLHEVSQLPMYLGWVLWLVLDEKIWVEITWAAPRPCHKSTRAHSYPHTPLHRQLGCETYSLRAEANVYFRNVKDKIEK